MSRTIYVAGGSSEIIECAADIRLLIDGGWHVTHNWTPDSAYKKSIEDCIADDIDGVYRAEFLVAPDTSGEERSLACGTRHDAHAASRAVEPRKDRREGYRGIRPLESKRPPVSACGRPEVHDPCRSLEVASGVRTMRLVYRATVIGIKQTDSSNFMNGLDAVRFLATIRGDPACRSGEFEAPIFPHDMTRELGACFMKPGAPLTITVDTDGATMHEDAPPAIDGRPSCCALLASSSPNMLFWSLHEWRMALRIPPADVPAVAVYTTVQFCPFCGAKLPDVPIAPETKDTGENKS